MQEEDKRESTEVSEALVIGSVALPVTAIATAEISTVMGVEAGVTCIQSIRHHQQLLRETIVSLSAAKACMHCNQRRTGWSESSASETTSVSRNSIYLNRGNVEAE